jgi:hypothetical protein
MRVTLLLLALVACRPGPEACLNAGGQCREPGGTACPNWLRDSDECNPDHNPGGAVCCLPCPSGTQLNDAGTACN